MPSILMGLLFFVIVLGIAVTIHEWGHFIIARKMGVRVLRFSVGFGKPLVKIKRGETEYCIAPIPLGGYVKMAGESYEEELSGEPWEFLSASPWRRIAIVFAGPAMNLVLAAVIFFLIYFLVGKPYTATHELGEVIPGSLGDKAGLQAGDVISSLNGKKVDQWNDIEIILNQAFLDEHSIEVAYNRQGVPGKTVLPVEIVEVGPAKFLKCAPVMDIIDLVGPAWDLGLQRGDLILSVSGEAIQYWHELYEKVRQKVEIDEDENPRAVPFTLTWRTPEGEEQTKTVTPSPDKRRR